MAVAEQPLHMLVDRAIQSYCRHISFEYAHLDSWEEQEWLRQEAEALSEHVLPSKKRWAILKHLFRAGTVPSLPRTVTRSNISVGMGSITYKVSMHTAAHSIVLLCTHPPSPLHQAYLHKSEARHSGNASVYCM